MVANNVVNRVTTTYTGPIPSSLQQNRNDFHDVLNPAGIKRFRTFCKLDVKTGKKFPPVELPLEIIQGTSNRGAPCIQTSLNWFR